MASLMVETRDNVDYVTLNRPNFLNALDDELTDNLGCYFDGLVRSTKIRVVVLRGAGRAFCSGLDLTSNLAQNFVEGGPVEKLDVQRRLRNIISAMRRCPQPIIAALHGVAAGGGFMLALASDIRIAVEGTRFNAAFMKIGVGGADIGASYLLPRLIGAGPSTELLLTGRMITADRALQLGILSEVMPAERLDEAVQAYVDDLLSTAPLALRLTKEVLNINVDAPSLEAALALEDRNQVILGQTENFALAVAAFGRREPVLFTAAGDAAARSLNDSSDADPNAPQAS